MPDSPYRLPDGNVQIAFSGGRTSAYMLHQILEENGNLHDQAVVTFQNTGREMPETLDFVQEIGNRWGVQVVWLEYRSTPPHFECINHNSAARDGKPLEDLIRKRSFLPNQNARFCTTELKVRTAKRYLRSLGWDYWTNCIGIRADEAHRSTNPPKDRWVIWRPLVEAGVSKRDVAAFWKRQPFDLRLPNVNGNCWLGNCDGCFLKSEANVAAFTRDYPARAAWWEDQEAYVTAMWPSLSKWQRLRRVIAGNPELAAKIRQAYGRPIRPSVIQMIVDKPRSAGQWSKRYARAELRNFIERQGDMAFSTDGLLCQADDGECTI